MSKDDVDYLEMKAELKMDTNQLMEIEKIETGMDNFEEGASPFCSFCGLGITKTRDIIDEGLNPFKTIVKSYKVLIYRDGDWQEYKEYKNLETACLSAKLAREAGFRSTLSTETGPYKPNSFVSKK